ncbi:glycosyltransferase family 2 protein [Paracoccus gahaiensis]|uniref:Glycosyltransferase family 2 protein n=1 Tax=Paracoccus gahaiensis TaxID=1706839 RepID=A0A4U0R6K4_9RHOB|nr:glycosyltransferase family 2 protein [Paracoccus gahaiensis]TJZ90030.1 glycosyltransferase family 2 protein [Paracoccus gahaiensis]
MPFKTPARHGAPSAHGSSLAVIIVNYGTADLTIAAIQSVLDRHHGGRRVQIHVVDNASPEDDARLLARHHAAQGWGARVTLWLEPVNHGFGRANNLVIAALQARADAPDYIFLLNPDAALENEALEILADRLDATPGAAVAGAGIALPSGRQVTAAFRFPSARAAFAQATNFGPITRLFGARLVPLPPDHPDGPVDWVAGAAVLIRLSVLRRTGAFDPDFFLYFEEVELMFRIRHAGHQVLYVPAARVRHAEGAATGVKEDDGPRKRPPAYWYESWGHYHLKTSGRGGALRAALGWLAGAALNAPLARLRGQAPGRPKGFFRDFPRHAARALMPGWPQ